MPMGKLNKQDKHKIVRPVIDNKDCPYRTRYAPIRGQRMFKLTKPR